MSNKTMTITDITKSSKEFKDTHTLQVGGFKHGGRINTIDLILSVKDELLSLKKDVLSAINKINDRLNKIEARIDNLVAKNNLKE